MSVVASSQPQSRERSLERSISRPSLTHSSSSTIDDSPSSQLHLNQTPSSTEETETLITPIDPPVFHVQIKNGSSHIKIDNTIDEELEQESEHKHPIKETKKGRLNLSKSMQTLRKKKGIEKGRERASSVGEKNAPPVPALPTISEKKPTSQPKSSAPIPTRPPMPTKQSSGFSSFLRKITGRSNTSPAPSTSASDKAAKDATLAKRKTLAVGSEKPALSKIDTSKSEKGPVSAVSKISQTPSAKQMVQSPMPITPVTPALVRPELPKETDPLRIPLPPSPVLEQSMELPSIPTPSVDFSASTPPASVSVPTVTKKKAEGMLSLEGFEFEEEEEPSHSAPAVPQAPVLAPVVDITATPSQKETEQMEESHDVVRPLAPIRIPSRNNTAGPASANSLSLNGTISPSSAESKINTPLSATSPSSVIPQMRNKPSPQQPHLGLSPEKMFEGIKLAGSSPPRKAPVGTGSMGDLGRKESKWRKSVMNISEKTLPSKRQSARPPPTSHDAYRMQQERLARNRQSCAPTLHSSASIAAAARGQMSGMKMSKDEEDMAETFFLS
ncbi:uncharacterized protein IL334_000556 [Kwoniella shivajii]|uniref:Uncharacterized protein n=1 Tax=Kwoniella shivajii TaxID=564305 RepID=A0ABZ1CPN1_9TREE|nr:hypothetical protein IL334_000556 [Kwoniella shivajii]